MESGGITPISHGKKQKSRRNIARTRGINFMFYFCLKKSMKAWYISMPWKVSIPSSSY